MRPVSRQPIGGHHERNDERAPRLVDDLEEQSRSRRPGRRRWSVFALVALALAAIAVASTLGLRSAAAPRYETAKVERGHISARVTATGTLSAVTTVQVGAQVSGRVSQLFVDFNTAVKKGQLLATLEPQLFEAAVDQAEAAFMGARGGMTKARAEAQQGARGLKRARSLYSKQLISHADLDAAEAAAASARGQLKTAEGNLAQAAANRRQAKVSLSYTKIVSPIDGVVISRTIDVGQTVAASLQAPTLFTIAEDLSKMQVDTNVAEADVGKLKPGMKAHFKVDAYAGEKFRGVLRQVRSAAQVVQSVVTYDAVIDVGNSDLKLKPGMTANTTFVFEEKADAPKIPTAALRFHMPPALSSSLPKPPPLSEGERLVWALRKGKAVPLAIHTGIIEGAMTEVSEGALGADELVVIDVVGAEPEKARSKKENEKDSKLKVF